MGELEDLRAENKRLSEALNIIYEKQKSLVDLEAEAKELREFKSKITERKERVWDKLETLLDRMLD